MKLLKLSLVSLFFGIIFGLPIAALLTHNEDDDTGSKEKISAVRFIQPNFDERSSTIKAWFQSSDIGAFLISKRYLFDAYALNSVNSSKVVSGGPNAWLFYKNDFSSCYSPAAIQLALNQIDALDVFARGADLELVISVSPDKSLVYPEYVPANLLVKGNCKYQNSMMWRGDLNKRPARIVDFLPALQVAKQHHDVYFKYDTHWNEYGQYAALSSLYSQIFATPNPGPRRMIDAGETIDVSPRNSDLSRMVRWIDADKDIKYKNVRLPSPQTQKPILIIHDSFFGRARNTLMQSLNKSMRMVHIRDFSKTVDQIPPGTLVLVNSVERSLFQRFQFNAQPSGEVNFLEPAILKSNATEANKCSYSGEMNETDIRFYDIQKAGSKLSLGRDPRAIFQVPAAVNRGKTCVEVSYLRSEKKADDIVFLQLSSSGNFETGYQLKARTFNENGRITFRVVLPSDYSEKQLRYDFGRGGSPDIQDLRIRFGSKS